MKPDSTPLLDGFRVIDFTQYIPGPFAAQVLSDLGADVVKVERIGGEPMRTAFGPLDTDGVSPFYKTLNAGKTVVELDLKIDANHATFRDLISVADVLIESFRPGALKRLGFDPVALRQSYPELVVCSISGYGQNGPYRLKAGHDLNYLAYTGVLHSTGSIDTPIAPLPQISDYAGALQATTAILAALLRAKLSRSGAYLDISLADTVLSWQSHALTSMTRSGYSFSRGNGNESGGCADYHIYQTADAKFVSLAAQESMFWENFCSAVGHQEWISRQRESVPQVSLINEVTRLFASQPLSHWCNLLDSIDCCFEPVLEPADIISHPQVIARHLLSKNDWPDPLIQVLRPTWIDDSAPKPRPAPKYCSVSDVKTAWDTKPS